MSWENIKDPVLRQIKQTDISARCNNRAFQQAILTRYAGMDDKLGCQMHKSIMEVYQDYPDPYQFRIALLYRLSKLCENPEDMLSREEMFRDCIELREKLK